MDAKTTKNIAVIGAGISGIAVGRVLQAAGHTVTIFEKSERIGGIWATTYPRVSLQNTRHHYFFSDFDYPEQPDLHPTGEQILAYLNQAIEHFSLDVRLEHELLTAETTDSGWRLKMTSPAGETSEEFDFLVVSTGQYNAEKPENDFPGIESFTGRIITELDIDDLATFKDKQVAVVGFGKSAVDMAAFAVDNGATVHHVFRTPRWLLPFKIFGIHYRHLLFSRMGTGFMPSWAHGGRIERFIHQHLGFLSRGYFTMVMTTLKLQMKFLGWRLGQAAADRLALVRPDHALIPDLRSALAMAPKNYYRYVGENRISPHHSEVAGFTETGIALADGQTVDCDTVVLSTGSKKPVFRFLPDQYRKLLEGEDDGTQLYRHMIHPDIPNLAFAGLNHGFMHVPSAEVGALWLCALLAGDIELPTREEQLRVIESIRSWKRKYIHFEPSRSCAVNTRFQQYNDIILMDLGLSPYRKMPNVLAELFSGYGAGDYRGVVEEFLSTQERRGLRRPLAIDT